MSNSEFYNKTNFSCNGTSCSCNNNQSYYNMSQNINRIPSNYYRPTGANIQSPSANDERFFGLIPFTLGLAVSPLLFRPRYYMYPYPVQPYYYNYNIYQ